MKKLQSNFTTPEQAYEIMRLGVNKSTADCWRQSPTSDIFVRCSEELRPDFFEGTTFIPCWSVGRLIEICLKCSTLEQRQVRFFCNGDNDEYSLIDYVVTVLESGVMTNHMDFLKL